jgi:DNA-directed RNA polymerase specialized sigma24 family protein
MDLEKFHREESGRILSTLIGLLGDFDLAEEMLQEAYATALQKWPSEGTPMNPRAWLVSAAHHKASDRIRRDRWFDSKREEIAREFELTQQSPADSADDMFPDDRLRLIFTCCHPALTTDAQLALTLRTVCGITTERSRKLSWFPCRPWPSAWSAPNGRFATQVFPIACPRRKICRTAAPDAGAQQCCAPAWQPTTVLASGLVLGIRFRRLSNLRLTSKEAVLTA